MKNSDYYLLLSIISTAPHLSKTYSLVWGAIWAIFCLVWWYLESKSDASY